MKDLPPGCRECCCRTPRDREPPRRFSFPFIHEWVSLLSAIAVPLTTHSPRSCPTYSRNRGDSRVTHPGAVLPARGVFLISTSRMFSLAVRRVDHSARPPRAFSFSSARGVFTSTSSSLLVNRDSGTFLGAAVLPRGFP